MRTCQYLNHPENVLLCFRDIHYPAFHTYFPDMSMLSLTAQWVDKDFVLKKAALHAQECAGSHTTAAFSMAFENMFET